MSPARVCSMCGASPTPTVRLSRGLCGRCYYSEKKAGRLHSHPPTRPQLPETCEANGCDRRPVARGLCQKHYGRARSGRPMDDPIIRMDPLERFWLYLNRQGPDDCWEWQGSRFRTNYGRHYVKRRAVPAYLKCEAQSEAARPIGDHRPFVAVAMPDGSSDGIAMVRLSVLHEFVAAMVENWEGL